MGPDDIYKYAIQSNARFARSLQWYKQTGREIINAKIQLTIYVPPRNASIVLIDYLEAGIAEEGKYMDEREGLNGFDDA